MCDTKTDNNTGAAVASDTAKVRLCLGYAEFEKKCQNVAGTPWTPYWCDRCDKIRRETITKQLESMLDSFGKNEVKP